MSAADRAADRDGAERVRPTVAVGGIALDERERVLLIQRGRPPAEGAWSIPGGRVELGETLHQACVREMREETGLEVEIGPVVEVLDRITRDDGGDGERIAFHYVIIDFLVRVAGGALRSPEAGDDARDARWIAFDELDRYPLTDGLIPVLERARALARSERDRERDPLASDDRAR